MLTMETAGYYFNLAFSVVCTVLQSLRDCIISVLEVNYDVVSKTITYLTIFVDILSKIITVTSSVFINIVSALVEFLMECSNFFSAFLTMVWKLLFLVLSFLNLVFRCLEQMFYFLWSGGTWTVGAIRSSWVNLKMNSANMYEYTAGIIYSIFSSLYGGLYLVGSLTIKTLVSLFYGIKFIAIATWELIDDSMDLFDRTVKYVTNSVYFFLTKFIPGLSKEVYFGILVCCITYFFLINLYHLLSARGMTFPFFGRTNHYQHHRHPRNRFRTEFSDDEGDMSDYTIIESEDETYISDDDEVEDIDEENIDTDDEDDDSSDESENEDTSSDESVATTNSNDIDIQLPPADARYNLRRSATPCRTKHHDDPDELVREVEHEREKQKCVVCQDEHKSVLILPCRHMCLCVSCGNKIARARNVDRRVCPLCRQRIRTIMNVYV